MSEDWNLFDKCLDTFVTPTSSPETIFKDTNILCTNCGCSNFVHTEGQHCCTKCGFISTQLQIHSSETSFPSNSDKSTSNARVGMPTNPLLPKSSLGSAISSKKKYSKGVQKICNYQIKVINK